MNKVVAALVLAMAVMPVAATAHPLGNFTSNHLTRLSVGAGEVHAHYVLDDAEIPTFTILRGLAADGKPSPTDLAAWAARHARETAPQLVLLVDGGPVRWTIAGSTAALRPGAGGLPTLYATADYHAALKPGAHAIAFSDDTLAGRIGWKDVVVTPQREPTDELRTYPNALLGSPRDRTAISLQVGAKGSVAVQSAAVAAAASAAPSLARMDAFAGLLDRDATGLGLAVVLLTAAVLGALHALEPGHGKTLLAVSLVGARATPRQALILASALTIAHTAGVLALGVVCLAFARFVVPESVYPWMTLASGALVALLGARALLRRPVPHAHHHDHDHGHHDRGHAHDHVHDHRIPGQAPLRFREALLAAASGNIAPCPAALVVLLAAIASHRVGFGLALIVVFGAGLAATLTVLGIAVVRGAGWLAQRPRFARIARFGPLVTGATISLLGAWTVGEGATALGVVADPVPVALAVALVIAIVAAAAGVLVPASRKRSGIRPSIGAGHPAGTSLIPLSQGEHP